MNAVKTTTMTLATLGLFATVGCQEQARHTRGAVSDEPLVIDQAMQRRQWEPKTASYENGSTLNCTTAFGYEPIQNVDGYNGSFYYLADTGTFFVNLVTSPYTIFKEWNGVESGGVVLSPSYTANPPLPPSSIATDAAVSPDKPTPIDPNMAPATQPK